MIFNPRSKSTEPLLAGDKMFHKCKLLTLFVLGFNMSGLPFSFVCTLRQASTQGVATVLNRDSISNISPAKGKRKKKSKVKNTPKTFLGFPSENEHIDQCLAEKAYTCNPQCLGAAKKIKGEEEREQNMQGNWNTQELEFTRYFP